MTLEAALLERAKLVQEIIRLETLMGQKNVRQNGRRLTYREWREWKASLRAQLAELQKKSSQLKAVIIVEKEKNGGATLYHLHQLLDLIKKLKDDGVDLDPDEEAVVKRAAVHHLEETNTWKQKETP